MDNRDGTYVKSDDGDRAVPEKDMSSPIHQPEEDSPLLGSTFLLGHGMNPRLAEAPPPGDTRVPIAPSGPSPGAAKKNNREVTAGQHGFSSHETQPVPSWVGRAPSGGAAEAAPCARGTEARRLEFAEPRVRSLRSQLAGMLDPAV